MKIGLVLDDTLDTPDGVQQYVLIVGAWLTSQGHDVHYLVGQTTRTDLAHVHSLSRNLAVKFNGNRMSMPLPVSRRRLRQFLREQQFDVLHVQVPYSPFMAGRLIKLVPPATAVIGTFHILPYSGLVRLANRGLALWNGRSGRRFDKLLAVSEPAKQFAQDVYGYKDMLVVPNPIRLSQFKGAGSADTTLTIVFLGRLVARKGAQHLLAAVAALQRDDLFSGDFRVHIGGKGELLDELQSFVTKSGTNDIVSFDGFVAETDKAAYLAGADIAVFPSISGESFGIVLLEAMATARGVVLAGNNPGYSSVMAPFADQLLDPTDTAQFATRLAEWLQNATKRGEAARLQKMYVEQFDVEVVGRQIVTVYKTALQSRPHS